MPTSTAPRLSTLLCAHALLIIGPKSHPATNHYTTHTARTLPNTMPSQNFITGTLLLTESPSTTRLVPGTIHLRGQSIDAVELDPSQELDLSNPLLILPAFVDAHLHLPQYDSIGIDGLPLLEWLERAIFPAEARWEDAQHAADMTLRVARDLISFGTTAFAAYSTVHHAAAQAAIDTLATLNLTAHVGQVLMDQEAPAELTRPADRLIAECASLRAQGRVQPSINPRFAITCSRALLHAAGDLASKTGRFVQTHLAETVPECARVRELHEESTYTDVYAAAGLLSPNSLLAHAIHLSDHERATLSRARAIAAHCPTANRFLNSGVMDRRSLASASVPIALGSDIAGGPDRSMVRVARAMLDAAKQLGHKPPTAGEAWHAITAGNAALLGFEDLGVLRAHSRADLILARPTIPLTAPDPLSTLLYAWDDRWIESVLVAGVPAYTR